MKKMKSALLCAFLAFSVLLLSSCSIMALSGSYNNGADYMTEGDVRKLIEGIEENITVNAGDNYNVNIDSNGNQNLLAASRGVLSAVSIRCDFDVVNVYPPSLFNPGASTSGTETSYGSGVIYKLNKTTGSAYIITNYHVVYLDSASTSDHISDDIKVYLYGQDQDQTKNDGSELEYAINAKYIGGSMDYDIAVLEVKNSDVLRESMAVAATFADSNEVAVLDTAIAIGNAEALGISATVGAVNVDSEYISMLSVDEKSAIALRVMRIDAAVNGGNSGGGLFNDKGEVIGIVNAKLADSAIDNIGYAIPSNVAKYIADNIIYYNDLDSNNDAVYRAMIGVSVDANNYGVKYDTETGKVIKVEDVVVATVSALSAADGKLNVGDRIKSVTVDGTDYEILRSFNVIDVMLTARKTSSVIFHVVRGGVDIDVTIDMSNIQLTKA